MANYDSSILIERIIDDLEGEMTSYNKYYEFDDCTVKVVGFISQDFDYDRGDWYTPPSWDLTSRCADLHSIEVSDDHGTREITDEEFWYIHKQLEL